MTNASAIIDQKINGQIGQPAACMIENKALSVSRKALSDPALHAVQTVGTNGRCGR